MTTELDSSLLDRLDPAPASARFTASDAGGDALPQRAPQSPFSLEGQTALITGGGSGIGLAVARSMHSAGARVVLLGRREDALARAAESLGERASYLARDITAFGGARAAVEQVYESAGPIHCLVNNAGVHVKKPAVEHTCDDFRRVFDTHILGAHELVAALAPDMMERGSGSILFIASMASLFGIPQVLAYSAAKAACLGMVRALATELSPRGVRVNAIAPGWIETEMSSRALSGDPKRLARILERTPMGALGRPEDVGAAAAFLASPAARFITGATLPVDGGASIGF